MLYTLKGVTPDVLAQIEEEKRIRKTNELFLLFSLGSQFDHLIKQALDKLGVFCLVADPATCLATDVKAVRPKGIILSGGPVSVYDQPPPFDSQIFGLNIPVLGICLGFQLWANYCGIKVVPSQKREFGVHNYINKNHSLLFEGCPDSMPVLESHGDRVEQGGLLVLGNTENALVAAAQSANLFGVQFHPEVTETIYGQKIFENFCFKICKANDRFPAEAVAEQKIEELKKQVAGKKVLLCLSGGSDSSSVAHLLKEAMDERSEDLLGLYIKGIDRPDDEAHVIKFFGNVNWLCLKIVDATPEFLAALKGKHTMHEKRVAMRSVYKSVIERECAEFQADFVAQGTLYTDISESGGGYASGAQKAQIKLHHNVKLNFSRPELTPLSDCVKDTGRNIGRIISVPKELLLRHPFPGPGLVVRIEGEINLQKLAIARKADEIYIEELRRWNLYDTVWQVGATLLNSTTTCTKGDDAASGMVICLWAVWSVNGFTARAAELPYDFLKVVSRRLTNEIREVGAVVYRTSDKPPATIEWG